MHQRRLGQEKKKKGLFGQKPKKQKKGKYTTLRGGGGKAPDFSRGRRKRTVLTQKGDGRGAPAFQKKKREAADQAREKGWPYSSAQLVVLWGGERAPTHSVAEKKKAERNKPKKKSRVPLRGPSTQKGHELPKKGRKSMTKGPIYQPVENGKRQEKAQGKSQLQGKICKGKKKKTLAVGRRGSGTGKGGRVR